MYTQIIVLLNLTVLKQCLCSKEKEQEKKKKKHMMSRRIEIQCTHKH